MQISITVWTARRMISFVFLSVFLVGCQSDPTTTPTTPTTNSGSGENCSDSLSFSSGPHYPGSVLTCYDDQRRETKLSREDTVIKPGTSCIFMSRPGHLSEGHSHTLSKTFIMQDPFESYNILCHKIVWSMLDCKARASWWSSTVILESGLSTSYIQILPTPRIPTAPALNWQIPAPLMMSAAVVSACGWSLVVTIGALFNLQFNKSI